MLPKRFKILGFARRNSTIKSRFVRREIASVRHGGQCGGIIAGLANPEETEYTAKVWEGTRVRRDIKICRSIPHASVCREESRNSRCESCLSLVPANDIKIHAPVTSDSRHKEIAPRFPVTANIRGLQRVAEYRTPGLLLTLV